jgi:hypothetical protein
MPVSIAFGKRLTSFVVDLDTIVINEVQANAPAEVHAEQTSQVLGQMGAGAA